MLAAIQFVLDAFIKIATLPIVLASFAQLIKCLCHLKGLQLYPIRSKQISQVQYQNICAV